MNEQERELDLLVAELEQENRLLRARNERLEREALAAPVQEDWGPGPHEVHSLPPAQTAPVQEPVPVFELQKTGWEIICDLDWIQTLPFGTKLYTTPPAQAVDFALGGEQFP
jgi:hypothetical protein